MALERWPSPGSVAVSVTARRYCAARRCERAGAGAGARREGAALVQGVP